MLYTTISGRLISLYLLHYHLHCFVTCMPSFDTFPFSLLLFSSIPFSSAILSAFIMGSGVEYPSSPEISTFMVWFLAHKKSRSLIYSVE